MLIVFVMSAFTAKINKIYMKGYVDVLGKLVLYNQVWNAKLIYTELIRELFNY